MFHSYSFIVLLFSLVLTGCGGGGGGGGNDSPSFLSGSPSAITVLPAEAEFVTGVTQQYTAIATFSDGSQNDITDGATWSVADESIATVDLQTGLLTTITAGTTAVTAEFRDVAASADLTVISSDLIQLVILPADASAPVGTTANYTAIAYFKDGSTEDVTTLSVWSSSDTLVVSIVTDGSNAGFAEAKKSGTANISAQFMGVTKTVPAIVIAATLEKIIVGPFKTTVGLETSVAYTAVGIYSDRSIVRFDDEVSWSSADESVATVNAEGIAFTTGVGATSITAAFSGISGSAAITVTAAEIVGLQIIPGSVTAPIGTNGQLQLVAFYLDGNTAVITADAIWSSSDISKATVQPDGINAGLLTLLVQGDVIITAAFDGQTASIPVTVTAAELQEILLEPLNPSIGIGTSVNFTATGIYDDGSSQDISDEVSWQSSAIDVATIDLDGNAQAISVGVSTVQASFGSVLGSTQLTVTGAFLESVAIVPGVIDVPAGTSGQLQAFAYYDDGSVVDVTADSAWISSNDNIIAVLPSGPNAGFSVARVAGSATISANFQSVAGSVAANVSNAVLEQLVLTPATASIAAGETQDYVAIGIYSDDSGQFLNDDVSWQSSAPLIATVDAKGRATGVVDGSATITVALDGFSANAQLVVSPATVSELIAIPASLSSPVGSVGQLQAVAVYTDATVSDVTALATWNSTNDAVITVVTSGDNAGQASALTEGFATVEVNYGGQLAIIDSTVIATVLTTILVEPVDTSIALGTEQAFTATGIYLDGTSQPLNEEVSWQSSNTAVASIDPSGVANGLAAGGTTITASFAGLSGATQLVVNAPVITSIQIEPSAVETPVGTAGPFTAIAYFSDLTTTDITRQAIWTSTDSAVVSVVATGVEAGFAQALIPGSASIKASFQGAEGIAPVVVTAATLTSIQVFPAATSVPAGVDIEFSAKGTYSDNSSRDITDDVNWLSSVPSVAIIDLAGKVNTLVPGDTQISANLGGITGTTPLNVQTAVVSSLEILPGDIVLPKGTLKQLTVSANFTDGSVVDVTANSTWTSSNNAIAFAFNAGQATGLVLGRTQGVATIVASFQGESADVTATVSNAVLQSIIVDPKVFSTPAGTIVDYLATGFYSDNSGVDLTNQVSWQSSNLTVASVGPEGVVNALIAGSSSIIATLDEISDSADLTVTSAFVQSIAISPANLSAGPGVEQQLTATASYSDSTVGDVTLTANWFSSDNAVATVDTAGTDAGLVKLISEGPATITAQLDGQSATAAITVTAAELQRIDVTPINKSVPAGVPVAFKATGFYSDNSTVDLTFTVSWQSSDSEISTITQDGLALTRLAGQTDISASYEGINGVAPLTVQSPFIISLSIIPVALIEPVLTSGQLQAIALYSNFSTADVTEATLWSSTDDETVTVVASGEDAGFTEFLLIGNAFVMADFGGASTSIPVEVIDTVLVGINISPSVRYAPSGRTTFFEAYGLFSDGSSTLINSDVVWTSADPTIGTIAQDGVATGVSPGDVAIRATSGVISDEATLRVQPPLVDSLQITPSGLTEPAGTSGQFTATAFYSDNTSVNVSSFATWGSSSPATVSVSNSEGEGGKASLLAPGTADITAAFDGSSDVVSITVTDTTLTAIEVTPSLTQVASGGEVRYSAVGVFLDGSRSPINDDVSWSSSATGVATIDLNGIALTNDTGSTVITAAFSDIQGTASLTVSAATAVSLTITPGGLTEPAGTSGRFTATLVLSDGSQDDVSTVATWSSSDDSVVNVVTSGADGGLAQLLTAGMTAQISASHQGLTDAVSVTVTAATLESISISPINTTIAAGTEIAYSAIGNFSDGTSTPIDDDVFWRSDNTAIATITQDGVAKGVSVGSTIINASLDVIVGTADITVSQAEVVGLTVSPAVAELLEGTTRDFTVTAVFTTGDSQDVTTDAQWTVDDLAVASVSNDGESSGQVTALTVGTTTVRAAFDGQESQADIAVIAPTIVSIEIIPQNNSIPVGTASNWSASATFSDASTIDITLQSSWFSSQNLIATAEAGVITGISAGATDVNIQYQTFTAAEPVTVVFPDVDELIITPSLASLVPGVNQSFIATAQFADGTNSIVTEDVEWFTDDDAVAVISNTPGEKGIATAVGFDPVDTANVTAEFNGAVSNLAVITVADLQLDSLRVEPATAELAQGTLLFFKAIGVFEDLSERDITTNVSWLSDNDEVVPISNDSGSEGAAIALVASGNATITASVSAGDGLGTLTATASVVTRPNCGSGNPDSIKFVPAQGTVSLGSQGQVLVYATYGVCEQDVTGQSGLKVESLDADIVVMENKNGRDGRYVGVEVGATQLEATYKGETALGDVEVIAEEVAFVEIISPLTVNVNLLGGGDVSLSCEAATLVGAVLQATVDVTGDASWVVDNPALLLEGLVALSLKSFTPLATGTAVISCNYGGKSSSISVVID